jgi:hypothetical protein
MERAIDRKCLGNTPDLRNYRQVRVYQLRKIASFNCRVYAFRETDRYPGRRPVGGGAARRFPVFFTATFFSPAFGMLTDPIGMGWMVYVGSA